jgi:hypothetical protein
MITPNRILPLERVLLLLKIKKCMMFVKAGFYKGQDKISLLSTDKLLKMLTITKNYREEMEIIKSIKLFT